MADVTLTYKGATIAELSESGSKTLRTAGKYCEADIGVEYVKPGGGADDFLARYVSTDPFVSDVAIVSDGLKFGKSFAARSIVLKNATGGTWYGQQYWLWKNAKVKYVVLPRIERVSEDMFAESNGLLGVDFGNVGYIHNKAFRSCTKLATIVLRKSSIVSLEIGALNNSTPFARGGTGGTIYIPKALYDHLGDGSSLDYKSATNWSTLDGYGTVTWAAIEGSIYETQYVDGTPISTT